MKTKLLFLTLFIGASLFTVAQSLVLIHEGEALEANATITVSGEPTDVELVVELDVENTSSANIDTYVQRYEIDVFAGTVNTFCWAGLCYPPFVGLSPSGVVIDGGTVYEADFSGHLNPNGTEAISKIGYTFFDFNNPNDSVHVIVNYATIPTSVGELNSEEIEVSTYPNPASDVLNLNLNSNINTEITFELLSITGATVRSEVSQQNNVKFNVSDLAEGLYLYRVSTNRDIVKTGRVVIKH